MKTYEAIAKLMEDSGENPHSLSPKVRIPQPTIYRIITGQTAEPKRANIEKFAKFFNVSADALGRGEIAPASAQQITYQQTPEPSRMTANELLAAYVAKLIEDPAKNFVLNYSLSY